MLNEFAIDPISVAEFDKLRALEGLFEFSSSRRISRFPNKWELQVLSAANNIGDMNKKRVGALLKHMRDVKQCFHKSIRTYPDFPKWCDNAILEHNERPFAAIVCNEVNPEFIEHANVSSAHPKFQTSNSKRVARTKKSLFANLKSILELASVIDIIDPWFNPSQPSCAEVFAEIFEFLQNREKPDEIVIRICTAFPDADGMTEDALTELIRAEIFDDNIINQVEIKLLPTHKMHDRHLLTDVASLDLSNSLSTKLGSRMTFRLVSHEDAAAYREEYFGDTV